MKTLSAWCRKHWKAYIVIIYVIGGVVGFVLGYQFCLWEQPWLRYGVYVYSLLGAV